MNAMSWNCRGLGNAPAIRELRALVRNNQIDCLMLQETKVDTSVLRRILRPLGFVSIVHVPPGGTAGGLCIAWKENLDLEPLFMSKNAISCIVYHGTIKMPWLISAIYGSHRRTSKIEFWEFIGDIALRFTRPWLIIGDFNAVLHSNGRMGGRVCDPIVDMMFNLLSDLGIIEIYVAGGVFSWQNNRVNGAIYSKIDRGMANAEWWLFFLDAYLCLLPKTTSNHKPLVLRTSPREPFTRRPFRFEAMWTRDPRSFVVVRHAWLSDHHNRPPNRFLNRMKYTRKALSIWNKYQFGKIQTKIASTRNALSNFLGAHRDYDHDRSLNLCKHLDELLKREELLWFQKSRIKWVLEEDQCTKFFFVSTLVRRKLNRIERILTDNSEWVTSRGDIGAAFMDKFKAIYYEDSMPQRVDLSHLITPSISHEANQALLAVSDYSEIRSAVFA
ncbi:hypothetical protein UlMin_025199 [Ulmus minor]